MRARSRRKDAADAVARGLELLDRRPRRRAPRPRRRGILQARVPAIVAGTRRNFDVLDVPTARGSAGIGIDATEVEAMRAELNRMGEAHRRTLDQLATGVAIFAADQRLAFYNTAYRSLWDLDAGVPRPEPDRFRACSTSCAPRASCPRRRTSANGRASCTRPIARPSRESTSGTCPTAAPCASSPRPTRKAA